MDIQTRIKNSEFRKEVLNILQSAKIHDKVEGSKYINEMPVTMINDTYMSIMCKLIQDIGRDDNTNNRLLHDVVLLCLCKSRKGKKFDSYYDEIISEFEKNISLSNKIFLEV